MSTILILLILGAVAVALRLYVRMIGRRPLRREQQPGRSDGAGETAITVLSWTFGLGLAFSAFSAGMTPTLLRFWLPGVVAGLLVSAASWAGITWIASRARR